MHKLCIKKIESIIFDLTDNLGKKETSKALDVYNGLISNKEPIQKILITLYNHFKKLYIIKIAEKYNVLIETKSTFNENIGTIINEKIEESNVKSIVKNDNLILVNLVGPLQDLKDISLILIENGITLNTIIDNSTDKLDISFTIHLNNLNKLKFLLKTELNTLTWTMAEVSRISLIGYGIKNNKEILEKTLEIFKKHNINILSVQIDETKLSIITKEKESDILIKELHKEIII